MLDKSTLNVANCICSVLFTAVVNGAMTEHMGLSNSVNTNDFGDGDRFDDQVFLQLFQPGPERVGHQGTPVTHRLFGTCKASECQNNVISRGWLAIIPTQRGSPSIFEVKINQSGVPTANAYEALRKC